MLLAIPAKEIKTNKRFEITQKSFDLALFDLKQTIRFPSGSFDNATTGRKIAQIANMRFKKLKGSIVVSFVGEKKGCLNFNLTER